MTIFKNMGVIFIVIFLIIIILIGIYFYKCLYYWQSDLKKTINSGFIEKTATLPDGFEINYSEGPDNGDALLLIHGQSGSWYDYSRVLPVLSKNWHVFAVDCYGHGKSSHNKEKYSLKENGDDLIWFTENIISKNTVVSGHSSGGLLAAYISAYGGESIVGLVLEDPPVFSTEKQYFEKSFAYHDTYVNIHNYLNEEQSECWEAYYMRHCLWGKLYMPSAMNGLANYAQKYYEKNPSKPVQYFFMPESINFLFLYTQDYDLEFGERFYDYSWHSEISHKTLVSDINIPTIFIHAKDSYSEDGILMAASSDEHAKLAKEYIGDCKIIELSSNHNIHRFNPKVFIESINEIQNIINKN